MFSWYSFIIIIIIIIILTPTHVRADIVHILPVARLHPSLSDPTYP